MAPGKSVVCVDPTPVDKSRPDNWKTSSFENFHGSVQDGTIENNYYALKSLLVFFKNIVFIVSVARFQWNPSSVIYISCSDSFLQAGGRTTTVVTD